MTTPGFSQYQQNIHRQAREQKAMGSVLSGLAISLIASILIVSILAAFGGWVLWKQIQRQSVTVAQLESRISTDIQTLQTHLKESENAIETLNTQTDALKQQLQGSLSQLEELRGQSRKDRAALQTKLQKIENRLYDIERHEALGR